MYGEGKSIKHLMYWVRLAIDLRALPMRTVGQKIRDLRNNALRESQELFGERFGVQQATVSRWESGSPVERKHQQPLAELAGLTVAEFFYSDESPRAVPIVGYVSAGDKFIPIEDGDPRASGEFVTISFNDQEKIAVIVRGDSMTPVYRSGDVIVGMLSSRSSFSSAIGRDCIVKTTSGEGFVKRVLKGRLPNTVRLRSYNPAYDDIEDVEVEWIAPIRLIERKN